MKVIVLQAPSMPLVKGIIVGSCVSRGKWVESRTIAHAHNHEGQPYYGWVCFGKGRSPGEFESTAENVGFLEYDIVVLGVLKKPSKAMLHEYAHLMVPNEGHTKKWANAIRLLGLSVDRRYSYRWKHRTSRRLAKPKKPFLIFSRHNACNAHIEILRIQPRPTASSSPYQYPNTGNTLNTETPKEAESR